MEGYSLVSGIKCQIQGKNLKEIFIGLVLFRVWESGGGKRSSTYYSISYVGSAIQLWLWFSFHLVKSIIQSCVEYTYDQKICL